MGKYNQIAAAYNIGKPSKMTQINNFVKREGPKLPSPQTLQPNLPLYDDKVVALLDYDYQADITIKNTIEFFTDKLPNVFTKIKFENTYYSTENTIKYLNEYYEKGYRYFILTSHSITVLEVCTWFNEHTECTGYTPVAQADILNIPKKIYTLTPYTKEKLDLYKDQCIIPYDTIYFMYSSDAFNRNLLNQLKKICSEEDKTLVEINTLSDASKITTSNINSVMESIPKNQNASIIISFVTNTNKLYNSFDDTTPKISYPFFENTIYPSITNPQSQNYFNEKLTICSTTQANLSVSYLWLLGLKYFGYNNYGFSVLNLLNMIYSNKQNTITDNVSTNGDSIVFNPVYKKNLDYSISILKYINKEFVPKYIYSIFDEKKYKASVSSYNFIQDVTDISIPQGIVGKRIKAAALLELSGYPSDNIFMDRTILDSLYYYWNNTNIFELFPIYNTNMDTDTTLTLLDDLYKKGTRIFLGFSRSTMLKNVLDWFNVHPYAIGISPTSSAPSLSTVKKNIYRLQIPDDFTLDTISLELNKTLEKGGKIFYILSKNEVASNEVLIQLQNTYGVSNVIYYEILDDETNLTQADLRNFFVGNNISENDTIVTYIIKGNQRDIYVNLFDENLIIPAKQYDIFLSGFPKIKENTSLKNLYVVLALQNITTTKLFINGFKEVGIDTFSPPTLNAMNMISHFSKGLKWQSLSSYNGSLHFTDYNDIKYGNIYNYTYTSNEIFEVTGVYSSDPLYGALNFEKY